MSSTQIKICGVRTPDIADVAIAAGADMVGVAFVNASPRYVTVPEARAVADRVGTRAAVVGLFKDHPLDVIEQHFSELPLDVAQIHGSATPGDLLGSSLPRFIRALSFDADTIVDDLHEWNAAHLRDERLVALIIDTPDPSKVGGGTGQTFDWSALRAALDEAQPIVPIILAGGLTPDHVAEAMRIVQPCGVDVSSGVEASRGVKDPARVRAFCEIVRGLDA